MKKIFFLIFSYFLIFFFFTINHIQAQNKKVLDSLDNVYKNAKHDTTRILVLISIALECKPDTCIALATHALEKSEKINYAKGKAYSLNYIAQAYYAKDNYISALEYYQKSIPFLEKITDDYTLSKVLANIATIYDIQGYYMSALEYYQKSLPHAKKINSKNNIATCLANIGGAYKSLGNYPTSIEYYFEALKIFEDLKNKKNVAYILNNIGIIYLNQGNLLLAQEYFTKSLNIRTEINDKKGMASCLNNIGNLYLQQQNPNSALEQYTKSLKIYEELNDKRGQAISLNNMGDIYNQTLKHQEALKCYEKALLLNEQIKNKWGITYSLLGLSRTELATKNYDSGVKYAEKSLQVAQEIKALAEIKNAYRNLYVLHKQKGNYEKALEYHQYFTDVKDSIFNEQNTKIIAKLESKVQIEKKQKEIEILNKNQEILKKDAQLQSIEVQRQKNARLAIEKQAEIDKNLSLANAEKNKHKADSLRAIAQNKQLELDKYFAVEQKLQAESKARQLEILKQKEAKEFQQYITYLVLISLFSVLIFTYFIFKSRQKEKKAKEEVLQQKQEISLQAQQLAEANTTKDKLFAIIGHDLRGPIGSLKSVLSLMLDNSLNKEDFDTISANLFKGVDNVYDTLNNLLAWADTQMQGMETNPKLVDLYDLVIKNFYLFAEKSENKHIYLKNNLPNPLLVWVDVEQINLVFRNLIANALKFTNTNGEIAVNYQTTDTHIQISIKDTGIGMNEETVQKIFKKNTHFTTLGTKGEKGTGLGLLLCQEMIEKNNGKIWVESIMDKGSTFIFTLPKNNK